MSNSDVKSCKATSEPRQPTRQQKREILDLLSDVYDTDQECYRRGDTDETVADVLGVMPGWVSQIREDLFGPDGSNEDMAALRTEIEQFLPKAENAMQEALQRSAALGQQIEAAQDIQRRLAKIEKAVGSRVLSKVGK